MDEGERIVSEIGAENFKMAERASMFMRALFSRSLQKRVWTPHERQEWFWKTDDSKFWVHPQLWVCLSET